MSSETSNSPEAEAELEHDIVLTSAEERKVRAKGNMAESVVQTLEAGMVKSWSALHAEATRTFALTVLSSLAAAVEKAAALLQACLPELPSQHSWQRLEACPALLLELHLFQIQYEWQRQFQLCSFSLAMSVVLKQILWR
jgi:hypothetical protein